MRTFSTLVCVAIFTSLGLLSSCGNFSMGVTGVMLSNQPILKEPDGIRIGYVVKGNSVACLGDVSPDSTMIKIEWQGTKGWVPMWSLAQKAQAGVIVKNGIAHFKPGESSLFTAEAGKIVATDSVSGEWTRIRINLGNGGVTTAWLPTTSISNDPKDVTLAINLEDIMLLPEAERPAKLKPLLVSNATSPLFSSFKVNLSEAPDDVLSDIESEFDLHTDKSGNTITLPPGYASNYITRFLTDIFTSHEEEAAVHPHSNYFSSYVSQLPAFVNNGPRYQYAETISKTRSYESFLLFRVDRSPENIKKIYDQYRFFVVNALKGTRAGEDIQTLITVHDHIFKLPNYQKLVANISKEVAKRDKANKEFVAETIEQLSLGIYEPIYHQPTMDRFNSDYDTQGLWYHSFWVRRIAEGNDEVVYEILKDLSIEVSPLALDGDDVYGDAYAEGDAEYGDYDDGSATFVCIFQDYSIGDCGHMLFDCGDYGDADTSELSAEDQELWSNLVVSDDNGEHGNPDYVGKQFELKRRTIMGTACNEGQGGEGEVPQILSFKLVANENQ